MLSLSRLSLRNIGRHPVRAVLVAAAVAVGTMLLVAVFAVQSSLVGSLDRIAELAGQADLQVVAPGDTGVDDELVDLVAETEGVAAAAPMIQSVVAVERTRVLLVGADARLAPFTSTASSSAELAGALAGLLTEPSDDHPVLAGEALAAELGLAPGDRIDIAGADGTEQAATVHGVVPADLNGGRALFARLDVAAAVAGQPGRVDSVLVQVTDDRATVADALEAAVGDRAIVADVDLQVDQVRAIVDTFVSVFGIVAGITVVIGGFLIRQTVRRVATERRRELATLRALGGDARPLLGALLVEIAMVAIAGAAAGALAGSVVGRSLVAQLPEFLVSALGAEIGYVTPTAGIVIAATVGVAAAIVAAWGPARLAVRVAPTDAMRPDDAFEDDERASTSPPLIVAGVVLAVIGTWISTTLTPPTSGGGAPLVLVGIVLVVRGLLPLVVRLATELARRLGEGGPVAAEAIQRAPSRVFTTTAAIAISLAVVSGLIGGNDDAKAAAGDNVAVLAGLDYVVGTGNPEEILVDFVVPDALAAELAAIPGVAELRRGEFATTIVDSKRVIVQGVPGDDTPALQAASPATRARFAAGEGVLVSRQYRDVVGIRDDQVTLVTPTGRQTFPVLEVVGVFSYPGGTVVMPSETLHRIFERSGFGFAGIRYEPGADGPAIEAAVAEVVADSAVPIHLYTGEKLAASIEDNVQQSMSLLIATAWIVVAAAGLVTVNTFVLLVLQRRRELGVLRAVGATARQVRGIVMAEVLATVVTGTAVGLPAGGLFSWLSGEFIGSSLGIDVPWNLRVDVPLVAIGAATILALAGSIGPARRAARVPVVEAIGYE